MARVHPRGLCIQVVRGNTIAVYADGARQQWCYMQLVRGNTVAVYAGGARQQGHHCLRKAVHHAICSVRQWSTARHVISSSLISASVTTIRVKLARLESTKHMVVKP